MAPKPISIIAQVAGSGTAFTETSPITGPYGELMSRLVKESNADDPVTVKGIVSSAYIMLPWLLAPVV